MEHDDAAKNLSRGRKARQKRIPEVAVNTV
jgi:hypothetical protein